MSGSENVKVKRSMLPNCATHYSQPLRFLFLRSYSYSARPWPIWNEEGLRLIIVSTTYQLTALPRNRSVKAFTSHLQLIDTSPDLVSFITELVTPVSQTGLHSKTRNSFMLMSQPSQKPTMSGRWAESKVEDVRLRAAALNSLSLAAGT